MNGAGAAHLPPEKNLVLIGLRGSGKSTVGRLLAASQRCAFVDSDEEIERRAASTVREIFAVQGEPAFREIEARVVAEILARAGQVVSVGGGAVLQEATRHVIRRTSVCAWLAASPAALYARLASDPRSTSLRPSLTHLSGQAEIEYLLSERRRLYETLADVTIDTTSRSPAEAADAIVAWLESRAALR